MSINSICNKVRNFNWSFSFYYDSRKIIFLLFPIVSLLALSEGLQLPFSLTKSDYRLSLSGVVGLSTTVLFFLFVLDKGRLFKRKLFIPGLLFLCSYLTMIHPPYILDGILSWLRIGGWMITFFVACIVFDKGERDLVRFFKLSLIAIIPPFVLACLTYVTGRTMFGGWFGLKEMVVGTLVEESGAKATCRTAATYFPVLLPYLIMYPYISRLIHVKFVPIILSIISFVLVWFSYGRALMGSFVMFFVPFIYLKKIRIIILLLGMLCFSLLIVKDWNTMRYRFAGTPIIKSFIAEEGELWETASGGKFDPVEMEFERSWIWLYALSQYWTSTPLEHMTGLGPIGVYDSGRNVFIGLLAESGPLALITFTYFIWKLLVSFYCLTRKAIKPYQKILGVMALSSLVAFLFLSMFDFPIRGFDTMWYTAILWGMACGETSRLKETISANSKLTFKALDNQKA